MKQPLFTLIKFIARLKCVLFFCLLTLLSLQSILAQKNKTSFDRAKDLWEKRNYSMAIPMFDKYVAQYPSDDWGHQFRILAYLDSGGLVQRLDTLYANPKTPAAKFGKAFLLFSNKNLSGSIELAEELYSNGYKSFWLLNLLGALERTKENFRRSVKYINEARLMDKGNVDAKENWELSADSLMLYKLRLYKGVPNAAFRKSLTNDLNAGLATKDSAEVHYIPNCFGKQARILIVTKDEYEATVRFYEKRPGEEPKFVFKETEDGSLYGQNIKIVPSKKRDFFFVELMSNIGFHSTNSSLFQMTDSNVVKVHEHSSQIEWAYFFEDLDNDGYPEAIADGSDYYVRSFAEGYYVAHFPVLRYDLESGISQFVTLSPEVEKELPADIEKLNAKALYYAAMEYWYEAQMIMKKIDSKYFKQFRRLEWNRLIIDYHYQYLKRQFDKRKSFLTSLLLGKLSAATDFPDATKYELPRIISGPTLSKIYNNLMMASVQSKNTGFDKLVLECNSQMYEAMRERSVGFFRDSISKKEEKLTPELASCQAAILGIKLKRVLYLEKELSPANFRDLYTGKNFRSTITSRNFSNLAAVDQYQISVPQGVLSEVTDEKFFREGINQKRYGNVERIIMRLIKSNDFRTLRRWFDKYVDEKAISDPEFITTCNYFKASEQLYTGKYWELIKHFPDYEQNFLDGALVYFYIAYEKVGFDDQAHELYRKALLQLEEKEELTASEFFTKAICLAGLGRTSLRQNNPLQAKDFFLQYLQEVREHLVNETTFRGYPDALFWLSKTYSALGETDLAKSYNEFALYFNLRANPPEGWFTTMFKYDYQFLAEYYLQKYQLAKQSGEQIISLGYLNASMSIINDLYKSANSEFDKMLISEIGKTVFEKAIMENLERKNLFDAFVLSSAIKDKTAAQHIGINNAARSQNSYLLAEKYLQSKASNNLLHYEVMEDRLVIFYKCNGNLCVHTDTTIGRQELEIKVNLFLDRMEGLGYQKAVCDSLSKELYQLLIAPVAACLTDSLSLAIRPDGILYHLPFAALTDGKEYLAEKYAIVFPSVSYQTLRQPWTLPNVASAMLGSKSSFFQFLPLKHAGNELDSVATVLSHHGVALSRLKDGNFTPLKIFKSLADKNLVHLSTHTLIDEFTPLNSKIIVQGEGKNRSDTSIALSDIFSRKSLFTNQPLIILSSCKSSTGQLTEEGMVGFGKLFIMRGASKVIGSTCEVSDISTANFFTRYYYYLVDLRLDAVTALRLTQIDMIAEGIPPVNWSTFIIHTK